MKTIEIYNKNVYGVEKTYIKDQTMAVAIQTLTGKITIDARDMKVLEYLGFTFQEVLAPKEQGRPEEGKVYALTGAIGKPCIANGNTWKESVVNA
jgi:hypothetical protein